MELGFPRCTVQARSWGAEWWVWRAGAQTTAADGPRPPSVWERAARLGTYLATSLKVFFLVMPAPLAALPFQGSGCRGVRGVEGGGESRK